MEGKFMKRFVLLGTLVAFSFLSGPAILPQSTASASDEVKLTLDGTPLQFDVQPRLLNGSLYVPLRNLTTALGANVAWEAGTSTATVTKGSVVLTFTVGRDVAFRNGAEIQMAAAPVMEQGQMLVPLRLISESLDFHVYWDGANKTVDILNAADSLPTVGSLDKLKTLLKEAQPAIGTEVKREAVTSVITQDSVKMKSEASAAVPKNPVSSGAPAMSGAAQGSADYSRTNVQVEGVDEADVIKTDGKYIYQVNRDRIVIADVYPADSMKVVSTLQFENREFFPRELYVDDKFMIVIGTGGTGYMYPADAKAEASVPAAGTRVKIGIFPPAGRSMTKAIVYDISDKTNLRKVREIELEGGYVTSRKVGSSLYLVANKNIDVFRIMSADSSLNGEPATDAPAYRDSLAGDSLIQIGYEDVRYFPQSVEPNYLIVAGLNLDKLDQKINVQSYLGAGQNVYASPSNLYVILPKYEPVKAKENSGNAGGVPEDAPIVAMDSSSTIYKFRLDEGNVRYAAKGSVPGRVLNQFSMDEQDGYFRIATTSGEEWRNDEHTSKNNLYVLNEKLEQTGKIEGIAPGEKIYSVRFMGTRAYMVTFRTVDPLFVIDLKDPSSPKILGQLKIPGYSDYLHPYDENHIIGFGKDAVEVGAYDSSDRNASSAMAYYQGMKIALFDVTDVANPVEMFKENIGDRGTDSELLRNHKALLFSKEKGLLAFPVTVAEIKNKPANPSPKEIMQYGDFTFQGAYVYHLDLNEGFKLRGKITHLTNDDLVKSGNVWYGGDRSIERILYIGDNLYTASKEMLKANDLNTLQELKAIQLK
jgi:uncharacterized secreted protein with C-terminal beta-propeller domain